MLLKQIDIINYLKDEDDDDSPVNESEFNEKMKAAEGKSSNHKLYDIKGHMSNESKCYILNVSGFSK